MFLYWSATSTVKNSLHRQEGSLIILDSWSPEPETHLVRRFGSSWFQKQRLSKLVPHEALRTVPIVRSSRDLVISQPQRGQGLICGPAVISLMPSGATFAARSGMVKCAQAISSAGSPAKIGTWKGGGFLSPNL